jgi:hypothetical protein
MTVTMESTDRRTLSWLRRGLLALTVISIGGAAYELASERHWNGFQQLIPWVTLAVLTAAVALAAVSDTPGVRRLVRLLAVAVLGAALFGIWAHVHANYQTGALDARYADTWDTRSAVSKWVYAVTKTVGPAPPLAPGMLGQSALLLLLATLAPIPARRPTT